MTTNPLQQFFRQPKIYVGLPSKGIFNKPNTVSGDINRMPIYGMTGMDEIILKTPDALLSGESTVRIFQSCCPTLTDPWDVSIIDTDLLLTAIRIATFGNELSVKNVCKNCGTENDYTINLNTFIDHFGSCAYEDTLVLKDMLIKTRPLTYKQSSEFGLENFQIQQQANQISLIDIDAEKKKLMEEVFVALGKLRINAFTAQIDSIEAGGATVIEKTYIKEFLENADVEIIDQLQKHLEDNRNKWTIPRQHVTCANCSTEDNLLIELDQANFFGKA